MNRSKKILKAFAAAVALTVAAQGPGAIRLEAMVVPTETAGRAVQSDREADLKTIQSALERKIVQQRLRDLGVSPKEVNARLGRLNDAQLHQVAKSIDLQNPAGDSTGIVLVAIGILLLLVLLAKFLKDDDDDDDDDKDADANTTINQNAPPTQTAPATVPATPPQDKGPDTIIVK